VDKLLLVKELIIAMKFIAIYFKVYSLKTKLPFKRVAKLKSLFLILLSNCLKLDYLM
jgi:hypothetical protein